jgi:hypothetical protein
MVVIEAGVAEDRTGVDPVEEAVAGVRVTP